MPLYEYECKACGQEFEVLVRTGDPAPTCVSCGSSDLQKLLHQVAVSTEHTRQQNFNKARKMAKKVQRDKDVAQFEYEEKHRNEH
jgi:putative FmdB family regulatory protein